MYRERERERETCIALLGRGSALAVVQQQLPAARRHRTIFSRRPILMIRLSIHKYFEANKIPHFIRTKHTPSNQNIQEIGFPSGIIH